jgi:hypothetical protein
VFGPPAGERANGTDYLTDGALGLTVDAPAEVPVTLSGASVPVSVTLERAGTVHLVLRTHDLEREPSGDATHDRPLPVTLAASQQALGAGTHKLDLTLGLSALGRLAGAGEVAAILTVLAIDAAGERAVAARRLTLA